MARPSSATATASRSSAGPSGARVQSGVVLVGTPATLRQLASMVAATSDAPVISGAVVVGQASTSPGGLGVPALGTLDDLTLLVARLNLKLALVCLPRSLEDRLRLIAKVGSSGIAFHEVDATEDLFTLPSGPVAQPASARHEMAVKSPTIDLAKLIGRTPHEMDRDAIARVLTGKRVLITGAGGSIGSELAKVAASFDPELLVLMERGENALFEVDRQIGALFPSVKRKAVLHDVVDAEATLRHCTSLRPHAVFHAAAHKHVPLMEDHPAHAVTNNLFGTKSIADAAIACGAERFVMISSDKAVNPTSVMGATKRLAEIYVRGVGEHSGDTRMSMVRFGNVLGSSASVLTIWAQQIGEGGPLTITDPRMSRYFMTIPEAATLVVQSTTLNPGGGSGGAAAGKVGVFVLDMGEPALIVDLAARFVRAHGLEPRIVLPNAIADTARLLERYPTPEPGTPAIDLVFTGIRPGEKLHEELAYAAEQLSPTAHPGIRSWAGPGFGSEMGAKSFLRRMVSDLHAARFATERGGVLKAIREHVPEMRSPEYTDSGGMATHPSAG